MARKPDLVDRRGAAAILGIDPKSFDKMQERQRKGATPNRVPAPPPEVFGTAKLWRRTQIEHMKRRQVALREQERRDRARVREEKRLAREQAKL